ncbi:uncharacterized protein LOC133844966 [Drosophila sulfurigaster albostrigata]|uniref:uncharacterized protein LOC133844966 n=1 Tax=Drosophila sulfurigaster albostrigata TaxID=89887 RepID=UPI002D21EA97|nr:uncharacterized protein LOC133844966 [Drosophila sulfurigaster albostrigata]
MDKLRPGDSCEDCQSQGLNHKLRWFYINLEEQVLKCEARSCLWPHNDEVSSDEEDLPAEVVARPESIDEVTASLDLYDDDDFIKELLEQLAPEVKPEPQHATDNIPSNSNPETDDLIQINEILELPPTQNICIDADSNSPKITTVSSTDKSLSATTTAANSMPDLTSNLSIKTDPFVLTTTSNSKTGDAVEFSTSFDPTSLAGNTEKVKRVLDIPKASVFQAAPKKASTLTTNLGQQKQQTKASPASDFLDALKRQSESRLIRPQRQQRSNRRNIGNAPVASRPNTHQVMQLLQSIDAQKRQKEIKTEPKQERETEAKQTQSQ